MGFEEEPFPFEGEGPGGGWDIEGMARTISELADTITDLYLRVNELERKQDDMTIIQPDQKNFPAMPRNRRNW